MRKIFYGLGIILFYFIFSSVCNAKINLYRYAEDFLKETKSPGVSISIMRKGQNKPVTVAAGYACIENRVKLTKSTVMKIGSVTKVFTGILIHILVDRGKLSLNSTLKPFFPNYRFADKITIKNLLTHTSGIPEILALPEILENPCKSRRSEEILHLIESRPLDFPPGTKAKYCNTNYLILGLIAQKVMSIPFFKLIMDNVASHLKIKFLYHGDDISIIPNMSCGYKKNKKGKLIKPMLMSMSYAFASGDFITSSSEIVKLVNVDTLLKKPLLDVVSPTPYILKDGSIAKETKKVPGMWHDREFYDTFFIFKFHKPLSLTFIGKLGMFPGFSTCFLYDPTTKYGVAVTSNLEGTILDSLKLAVMILTDIKLNHGLNYNHK